LTSPGRFSKLMPGSERVRTRTEGMDVTCVRAMKLKE
jgi:hypothetical protein